MRWNKTRCIFFHNARLLLKYKIKYLIKTKSSQVRRTEGGSISSSDYYCVQCIHVCILIFFPKINIQIFSFQYHACTKKEVMELSPRGFNFLPTLLDSNHKCHASKICGMFWFKDWNNLLTGNGSRARSATADLWGRARWYWRRRWLLRYPGRPGNRSWRRGGHRNMRGASRRCWHRNSWCHACVCVILWIHIHIYTYSLLVFVLYYEYIYTYIYTLLKLKSTCSEGDQSREMSHDLRQRLGAGHLSGDLLLPLSRSQRPANHIEEADRRHPAAQVSSQSSR